MKSKKMQKTFSKKELGVLVLAVVSYFFYMQSKDSIVNYPTWLNYLIFSLALLTVCVIQKKGLLDRLRKVKNMLLFYSFVLDLIGVLILSGFISGIILMPFNYLNIYLSKRNDINYVDCQIKKVSTFSKNRKIFYEFNGQVNVLYAYKPIMEDIKNTGNYKDYVFIAEVREGLMGSYILENWDIKRK